jgi:hypothetical protein
VRINGPTIGVSCGESWHCKVYIVEYISQQNEGKKCGECERGKRYTSEDHRNYYELITVDTLMEAYCFQYAWFVLRLPAS